MKFLSLALIFVSLNAFSAEKNVRVKFSEEVTVICPETSTPVLNGSKLSCGCPSTKSARTVNGVMRCESVCLISVKELEEYPWCDQGGCAEPVKYKALVVEKDGYKILEEKISSVHSREIELLLPRAKEVAKEACFKTMISL